MLRHVGWFHALIAKYDSTVFERLSEGDRRNNKEKNPHKYKSM